MSTVVMLAGSFLRGITHVGTGKVVDRGLGKHGVVLEERLAQRGSVLGDDHELRLAVTEALEGGFLPRQLVRELQRHQPRAPFGGTGEHT